MRALLQISVVALGLLQLVRAAPDPDSIPTMAGEIGDDDTDSEDDEPDALLPTIALDAPRASVQTMPDSEPRSTAIFRDVIFRLDRPPRA